MERERGLKEKIVIVTGAGSGIGQAIAIRFAEEGCLPILVDIDEKGIKSTRSKIEALGVPCMEFQQDVTDRTGVEQMVEKVQQTVGTCDILINCAGIFFSKPFEELNDAQWEEMIKVNLTSCFITCQVLIRNWLKLEHKGVIINVGSISATRSNYGASPYSAAKAGVESLSRSIAVEYSERGIRALTLSPGFTETPLTIPQMKNQELYEQWLSHIPMRRMAKPSEIAEVAVFLASDGASYITGNSFIVDGGYLQI